MRFYRLWPLRRGVHPTGLESNFWNPGAVAQLGERLICIQEVVGSIPISSTSLCRTVFEAVCHLGPVAQVARARP